MLSPNTSNFDANNNYLPIESSKSSNQLNGLEPDKDKLQNEENLRIINDNKLNLSHNEITRL